MDLAMRYFRAPFKGWRLHAIGIAIILGVSTGISFGQKKQADSLISALKSHSKKDSIYLGLLTKASIAYATVDAKKGMDYTDQAIALAKQFSDSRSLGNAYMAKAKIFEDRSEPKNALPELLLALNEYSKLNNKADLINCYLKLYMAYYSIADYAAALNYAGKAMVLSQQTGDKKLLMRSYTSMGISYNSVADYPNAINYFFKVLRIAEEVHDKSYIAKTAGNLGVIYYFLKKYPEALKYSNECLKALDELGDKLWMAAALNNIGGIYLEMKDYPKAITYNKRALEINRLVKSRKGEANDLNDMGVAYFRLNNYSEAFSCLNLAIQLYDGIGAKNNSSLALGHLAEMYMNAPAKELRKQKVDPANRISKALAIQLQAVQLAKETKNLSTEADQWKALSIIYQKQGNYKEALSSYRNYSALNDSVFNDKKREALTRLSMQYNYDKKEAGIKAESAKKQAKATAELDRQKIIKNSAIIVGLILLISGATTFAFYKRKKDAKEKLKDAEYKAHVAETEMKALRSQLNPHFIFNSLNSIGDYIARHDKETADTYLVKFAKLMRMILENSEHQMISLADDLKTLELYIQLEALRLGQKFLYEIVIDPEIDTEQAMVPPMLLQPFVENSIWHGISPKNGSGHVIIRVKKEGEMIEYMVEDNGIGRERSAALKKGKNGSPRKSFGIKVIQSRINIINEAKHSDAQVELTDLDEGTRVSIRLPYELKF